MNICIHENSELELNPLRYSQPVQMAEERVMWSYLDEENTSRAAEFISCIFVLYSYYGSSTSKSKSTKSRQQHNFRSYV